LWVCRRYIYGCLICRCRGHYPDRERGPGTRCPGVHVTVEGFHHWNEYADGNFFASRMREGLAGVNFGFFYKSERIQMTYHQIEYVYDTEGPQAAWEAVNPERSFVLNGHWILEDEQDPSPWIPPEEEYD
jgi:hypothetical protein